MMLRPYRGHRAPALPPVVWTPLKKALVAATAAVALPALRPLKVRPHAPAALRRAYTLPRRFAVLLPQPAPTAGPAWAMLVT